jgi:hypothetical protein
VTTPPYCDNVDQSVDDGCLLLSDDFLQYWLGAYLFVEDGGTDSETGEPVPLAGSAGTPFEGLDWTLNGGDSADNHHPNASRGTTQSFVTTSSLLKPGSSRSSRATPLRRGRPAWQAPSARTRAATTCTRTGPTSRTSA